MYLNKKLLREAVRNNIIGTEQADALWQFLQVQNENKPQFKMTHVLYYLGGFLAIGAMSLFMNLGWETWGGGAIVALCMLYMLLAYALLHFFQNHQLDIPAAICTVFMVVLVSLAVYGIEDLLGLWKNETVYRDYHEMIDGRWLSIELATISAGLILFWRYRYPFLLLPISATIWYMSIDISDWLFVYWGIVEDRSLLTHWVSIVFGLMMFVVAVLADYKDTQRKDYAYWLYIFGASAFWGGLSLLDSHSEWGRLLYALINVMMMFIGVLLQRRVFTVFGSIGLFLYLGDLSHRLFKDSWFFPISLTTLGLIVIWLGLWWQKNGLALIARFYTWLPPKIRAVLLQLTT